MKNIFLIFATALCLTLCSNCSQNKSTATDLPSYITADTIEPTHEQCQDSFEDFIERFHSDSIFQLTRISHPLKGFYSEYMMQMEDSLNHCISNLDSCANLLNQALADFEWSEDLIIKQMTELNMVIRHPEYKTSYAHINNDSVVEKICHTQVNELYESKFSRKNGKWILTEYTHSFL